MEIVVNQDSTLTVTESITVVSEGNKIKRGIFREFPTKRIDDLGQSWETPFDLISVTRDGSPENFKIDRKNAQTRVYIGQANVFLKPGEYNYTIKYVSSNQIGFYQEHDELYWNVTGNLWDFPIESASATVFLPEGINSDDLQLAAFTGPAGSTDKEFTSNVSDDGLLTFSTSTTLPAHHGNTIAVGFPTGLFPSQLPHSK